MAQKEPAPISLSKGRAEPARQFVAPFNKDTPEHKERVPASLKVVNRVVKDPALEARVALLEGEGREVTVQIQTPPRPRIRSIAVKYDTFGAVERLIPIYEDEV